MRFAAKRDWFTYPALLASLALIVLGIFFLAVPPPQPAHNVPQAIVGCVLPLVGGLLLWAFLTSSYAIRPPYLVIRFGPIRRRIPLDALVEVIPRQKILPTDWGWSLAWSLDRVCLRYRKPSGKMAWPLTIAPQEKGRFLRELRKACPEVRIHQHGDGVRQAGVVKEKNREE